MLGNDRDQSPCFKIVILKPFQFHLIDKVLGLHIEASPASLTGEHEKLESFSDVFLAVCREFKLGGGGNRLFRANIRASPAVGAAGPFVQHDPHFLAYVAYKYAPCRTMIGASAAPHTLVMVPVGRAAKRIRRWMG